MFLVPNVTDFSRASHTLGVALEADRDREDGDSNDSDASQQSLTQAWKCLHNWCWPRSSKPLSRTLTVRLVGSIPMHFRFVFPRDLAVFPVFWVVSFSRHHHSQA